jgi:hypothetical protein
MISGEDGPLPGTERNWNLRYFSLGGSSGPSVCPPPLTPGKVLPLERSLKHVGLLPDLPGTYKIIVSWSPYTTRYSSCEAVPAWNAPDPKEEPFTTVFSPSLEIEIAGPAANSENAPQIPEYTAWKPSFTLTKTSFGDQTALLDNATHLAWLRLNLSADLSYDQVTEQMSEGGRFSGWRYATSNESRTLFKHFIGGSDTTTNLSIEDKLQRLLGGPLNVDGNTATGWYRTDAYLSIVYP